MSSTPEARRLPDHVLSPLSEFIAAEMGLHFPRERWSDLGRGLVAAAREFGFENAESCASWLQSFPLTRRQVEILASCLTVGETYFFREKKSFEILEKQILPELIHSRRGSDRRLRIWSAGCATGEEPYSVAILLNRLIPDLKEWNITILATDINTRFLRKAADGVYSQWSFRDCPPYVREAYFETAEGGRFELAPQIRKTVTFSYVNLAEDVYPSLLNNTNAMDVILCRNVLMYFAPEPARRAIRNLHRCLVEGGWLVVSPAETSHILYSQFDTTNLSGLILYRKDSQRLRAAEVVAGPLPEESRILDLPALDFSSEQAPETARVEAWEELVPPAEGNPTLPEAEPSPQQKAVAFYELGRYAEAAEVLQSTLSEDAQEVPALALLARAYANQGKLGQALEWCDRAIAADKLNPPSHYLRATILQEQGSGEEAMASLKRALYLDPDFVLAHFALGNLSLRQGRVRESARHFENALFLLSSLRPEEVLAESEGVIAGRLKEVIAAFRGGEASTGG